MLERKARFYFTGKWQFQYNPGMPGRATKESNRETEAETTRRAGHSGD